jgi:hypothetical protein
MKSGISGSLASESRIEPRTSRICSRSANHSVSLKEVPNEGISCDVKLN